MCRHTLGRRRIVQVASGLLQVGECIRGQVRADCIGAGCRGHVASTRQIDYCRGVTRKHLDVPDVTVAIREQHR
jgi:hypothetical protein